MILLAVECLAMLVPARRVNVPELGGAVLQPVETTIWLLMLAYLLWVALPRHIPSRRMVLAHA
jgi:hypothetical protein